MSIGENIRKRRLVLGLSKTELKKKAGVCSITLWESGKQKPQIYVLVKLAKALDCELGDLIKDEEN